MNYSAVPKYTNHARAGGDRDCKGVHIYLIVSDVGLNSNGIVDI